MNNVQPAFAKPPWSFLRKLSAKTMITIQMYITKNANTIIDQRTSRNG